MHSTHLRREHIHGVLIGAAIGEALGYARNSLTRRTAIEMFGRSPLHYSFVPKHGVYGDDTRLTIMNAQALLNSRCDLRSLRRAFTWRLSWYLLSLPSGARRSTLTAASRAWLRRLGVKPGVDATDPGACSRAIFSTLAIHGTGHRLHKWVEESTRMTHTNPQTIDCCKVLATLAECGINYKPDSLDSQVVLQAAIEASSGDELKSKLSELSGFLHEGRAPSAVARRFGWETKIDDHVLPVTVMSTFCWLRYPNKFRRAVESAICLGGASSSLGCIVGSLVGAHLGQAELSRRLLKRLNSSPHDAAWIEALAERFSHWPHGADDLHVAPAQSSDPIMQFIRNVSTIPYFAFHTAYRLPFKHSPRRLPRRLR